MRSILRRFSIGLLQIGDIPDVACLIAPRPLLAEMGTQDQRFIIEDAGASYAQVECLYRVMGYEDRVDCDVFEGAHAFSGRKIFDWFERWL